MEFVKLPEDDIRKRNLLTELTDLCENALEVVDLTEDEIMQYINFIWSSWIPLYLYIYVIPSLILIEI